MKWVRPHEFVPLQRYFNRNRCLLCYVHEHAHPVTGSTWGRVTGDKTLPGDIGRMLTALSKPLATGNSHREKRVVKREVIP